VSSAIQLEYEYRDTARVLGYTYSKRVRESTTVGIGKTEVISKGGVIFSVGVADEGFVTMMPTDSSHARFEVAAKDGGKPAVRILEPEPLHTGGMGLKAMLRDGNTIVLAPDPKGTPREKISDIYKRRCQTL